LDEKEKKAEMLMEADKQNDEGEKGAKPVTKDGVKDDQYFSEILFKDLNLSE
jgi:ATP-dependent RNA helicase DDX18/HAS1